MEQERVTTPSTCTEQAPHSAMPQPYLVPVSPTHSRISENSIPIIIRPRLGRPCFGHGRSSVQKPSEKDADSERHHDARQGPFLDLVA